MTTLCHARPAKPGRAVPFLCSETHPEACMGCARRCARLCTAARLERPLSTDRCEGCKTAQTRPLHLLSAVNRLFANPVTSIRELAEVLVVSFEAARRLVGSIEERGVLEEITGRRRSRVYASRRTVRPATREALPARGEDTCRCGQKFRPPQPIQWTSQTTRNRKALDVTDLSLPATPNVNVPPHHPPERRA
jgi:hypothetical protein